VIDPNGHKVTVAEQAVRYLASRGVEPKTLRDYRGTWRNHLEPYWGDWPMGYVTRIEVETWLARSEMSARTAQKCLVLLGSIMASAVEERLIPINPVKGVRPPRSAQRPPRFLSAEESEALLSKLSPPHDLFVDLMLNTGLRWGEAAGLRRQYVDTDRGQLAVVGVITEEGYRTYPKSKRSNRVVPIPGRVNDALAEHLAQTEGEYAFTSRHGGHLIYRNWRERVWLPAVKKAELDVTPHNTRHTYASRLVQAGVPLYRVQELLGHESPSTTMIYAHLAPDAFDAVREALA
jgi:integrase